MYAYKINSGAIKHAVLGDAALSCHLLRGHAKPNVSAYQANISTSVLCSFLHSQRANMTPPYQQKSSAVKKDISKANTAPRWSTYNKSDKGNCVLPHQT